MLCALGKQPSQTQTSLCKACYLNSLDQMVKALDSNTKPWSEHSDRHTEKTYTHTWIHTQLKTGSWQAGADIHMQAPVHPSVDSYSRRAHRTLPFSAQIILERFILAVRLQLMKMFWEQSFLVSPDAAVPHCATIYGHKSFIVWHVSAWGIIHYWV